MTLSNTTFAPQIVRGGSTFLFNDDASATKAKVQLIGPLATQLSQRASILRLYGQNGASIIGPQEDAMVMDVGIEFQTVNQSEFWERYDELQEIIHDSTVTGLSRFYIHRANTDADMVYFDNCMISLSMDIPTEAWEVISFPRGRLTIQSEQTTPTVVEGGSTTMGTAPTSAIVITGTVVAMGLVIADSSGNVLYTLAVDDATGELKEKALQTGIPDWTYELGGIDRPSEGWGAGSGIVDLSDRDYLEIRLSDGDSFNISGGTWYPLLQYLYSGGVLYKKGIGHPDWTYAAGALGTIA